ARARSGRGAGVGGAHARPRLRGREPVDQARGHDGGLYSGECSAADRGDATRRAQISDRRRDRRHGQAPADACRERTGLGILASTRGGWRPLTAPPHARRGTPTLASRATAVFAGFFFLSGFTQTILVTVLPVVTLSVMNDAQIVSLVYVAVGLAGFLGRLGIPALTRVLRRVGV